MKDVQKRFEGDTTEGTKKSKKSKALSGATESLMSSDALKRLDANQRAEVLSKIESESKNLVPDLPVSIVSETKGLTLREQFKQGFEEYINSSKEKDQRPLEIKAKS